VAGIGFELRRVLQKGGLTRILGVGLAGTAVVAGPWLLSVFGIFLIQHAAGPALGESPLHFSAAIVFSYTVSLVLMSGLHYGFTRLVSDLVYEEKNREAGSALLACLLLVFGVSAAAAAAGILPWHLGGTIARPALFGFAAAALFVVINLNWIVMSFISLLRSYLGILAVYLAGAGVSLGGVILLGRAWGTAGALLGYTAGQLVTVIVLYLMSLARYRPSGISFRPLFSAIRRHPFLALSGLAYAWATWADKVVSWALFGHPVAGTWMRTFDPYDIPIFFAILTLVPGLVYFTIETETAFYPRLREFLRAIATGTWRKIQVTRRGMVASLAGGLREQTLLQGLVSLGLIVFAPSVAGVLFGPGVDITTLRVTLAAVFLHALFLSIMIFLFYFELYGSAFAATVVFLGINLAASLLAGLLVGPGLLGLGYLCGGAAGCAAGGAFLSRAVRRIDRILFLRAAG
jgi:polysaccharide biosynthesis protein PelG